jgi:hypothetical protein
LNGISLSAFKAEDLAPLRQSVATALSAGGVDLSRVVAIGLNTSTLSSRRAAVRRALSATSSLRIRLVILTTGGLDTIALSTSFLDGALSGTLFAPFVAYVGFSVLVDLVVVNAFLSH